MAPSMKRKYAVAVFGCTGNAGRACSVFAIQFASSGGAVALCGRNEKKVSALRESVLEELKLGGLGEEDLPEVDVVIADASDADSMLRMARSARVVLACAGPYGRYGESAVSACIEGGAHYVDITGEVPWVEKMINKYEEKAKRAGVSLLSFSGYDCVPAELAFVLSARELGVKNIQHLDMVFSAKGGGFPKGTLNTIMDGIEGKGRFPRNKENHKPFIPRPHKKIFKRGLSGLYWLLPIWIPHAAQFTTMNFMAAVNIPIISRAAASLGASESLKVRDRLAPGGRSWGSSFLTLFGLLPWIVYQLVGLFGGLLLLSPPFRWWLKRRLNTYNFSGAPQGKTRLSARGSSKDGKSTVDVRVSCSGDPGIYATGRFAAAVSWALVDAEDSNKIAAGFNSPVVAFWKAQQILLKRLESSGVSVTATTRRGEQPKSAL